MGARQVTGETAKMDVNNYPIVSGIQAMMRIIMNSARVRRPSLFLGPPGIGKTAGGVLAARHMGLHDVFLELGLTVQEEIGGVPVRDERTGTLMRLPLSPIAKACSEPSLLIIDEVTRADSQRQGAAMTGVNERRWGDYLLHPNSAVVLFGNEPESGGTHTILDALLNRCGVYRVEAKAEEVRSYLYGLGGDDTLYAQALRRHAQAWAMFSENRPGELLQLTPPRGFAETGALWASPRAIEQAVQRLASLEASGLSSTDELALIELQGVVGRPAGVAYMQLQRLTDKCPSAKEIQADPTGARLPSDLESLIAINPVVLEVSRADIDAAWLYTGRLADAHKDASKILVRKLFVAGVQPKGRGNTVYARLSASIGSHLRNVEL